jgi:DNA-binding transcriptional ArsR family regulator
VPDDLDAVFKALADATRRLILDRLREEGGQTLVRLCAGTGMSRQAVAKHLAVLRAAELVTVVPQGREHRHYLNPVPINEIQERWIVHYERDRLAALALLKKALEDKQ